MSISDTIKNLNENMISHFPNFCEMEFQKDPQLEGTIGVTNAAIAAN